MTGIIEAKLDQQLAHREQCPLYGIFLDLKKAYNAIDRERCLKIFEDSKAGSKCIRLLRVFWDIAELVYRASVLRSGLQGLERGDSRGALSTTIFNLMVHAVVRQWM